MCSINLVQKIIVCLEVIKIYTILGWTTDTPIILEIIDRIAKPNLESKSLIYKFCH